MRGYFGVAIYRPKTEVNVGTLIRTARILGASWVCTIGKRYKHQPSDTMQSTRHMPLFHYENFDDFKKSYLVNCELVAIELYKDTKLLENFIHPVRACYMVGAEDSGIPDEILKQCDHIIQLRGERSMNVAVAGSIVLYNR